MKTQMSRDFERLSAYIDDQLSLAEKAELETRLASEPELRAGLSDLRRTVRALRSLPSVKPPRSFTLTPEQAGARAGRGPLFPVLRLATALCTLLLAVAVARDFATGGLGASTAHDLTAQRGAATPALVPQAAALFTPTPEVSAESQGASAPVPTGATGGGLAVTPQVRANVVRPSATAAAGDQQPAATPGVTIKNTAPGETPGPNYAAIASVTPEDTVVSVAGLPPAATDTAIPNLVPELPTPVAAPFNSLRLAEIALAVLALALGAAAWLTRRG